MEISYGNGHPLLPLSTVARLHQTLKKIVRKHHIHLHKRNITTNYTSPLKICSNNSSLEENISVGMDGFGDFALNILLIYYIKSGEDNLGTKTNINLEIIPPFRRSWFGNGLSDPNSVHEIVWSPYERKDPV